MQRARLVLARQTRIITAATAVEATVIAVVLTIGIGSMNLVGAVVAAGAILAGRLCGNLFLVTPALLRPRMVGATADSRR